MAGTSSSGGHNRQSAAQHRLAGTYQKSRHAGGETAEFPKGRPSPPKLKGVALAEWTRMVDRLDLSHTLSKVDDAALYQYACLFAETEAIAGARIRNERLIARLHLAMRGLRNSDLVDAIAQIVQLKKLETKHTSLLRAGHMAIRQYLVEFGLTPAARGRVKAGSTPAPEDPFAEFDGDKSTPQ